MRLFHWIEYGGNMDRATRRRRTGGVRGKLLGPSGYAVVSTPDPGCLVDRGVCGYGIRRRRDLQFAPFSLFFSLFSLTAGGRGSARITGAPFGAPRPSVAPLNDSLALCRRAKTRLSLFLISCPLSCRHLVNSPGLVRQSSQLQVTRSPLI